MHQFLSPLYNTRTDEYGGSLENRMRFTQEALRAMRAAVGEDFVVGIRAERERDAGQHRRGRAAHRHRERSKRRGSIDFVDASRRRLLPDRLDPGEGMDAAAGYELRPRAQLTEVASVPTIVTGRFRTLEEAEQVLADGVADMVSMVRAHIADPDIVRKTREGRAA